MQAIEIQAFGDPSAVRASEIEPPPAPAEGQVRLNVAGVGVGYFDGLLIRGDYQIRPELPFIPGSSLSGIVESVGAGVTKLVPGDHVAAFALSGGLAEWTLQRQIDPAPTRVFPLAQAGEAFAALFGRESLGSIAIQCQPAH